MIEVFNGTEIVGPDVADVVYLWTENDVPCYVGYTNQYISDRMRRHLKESEPCLFQNKLRKRPSSFKCYIVAHNSVSLDQIHELETFYIKKYNTFRDDNQCGYNLTTGGDGNKLSNETKRKISISKNGIKLSDATKKRMSISKRGIRLSQEHRNSISKTLKGITHSKEARERMSKSQKGKKRSDETKRRMSESAKRRCLQNKRTFINDFFYYN